MDTRVAELIDAPTELADFTRRAARHLGVDVLALDALELEDGSFVVLESNKTPGLTAFPEATRHALAARLQTKLSAST